MPRLQVPFLLPSSSQSCHPKCRRNPEGHGLQEQCALQGQNSLPSPLGPVWQLPRRKCHKPSLCPPFFPHRHHTGASTSEQTKHLTNEESTHRAGTTHHVTLHHSTVTMFSFQVLITTVNLSLQKWRRRQNADRLYTLTLPS